MHLTARSPRDPPQCEPWLTAASLDGFGCLAFSALPKRERCDIPIFASSSSSSPPTSVVPSVLPLGPQKCTAFLEKTGHRQFLLDLDRSLKVSLSLQTRHTKVKKAIHQFPACFFFSFFFFSVCPIVPTCACIELRTLDAMIGQTCAQMKGLEALPLEKH